jgi:Ca-activated chloride channel family protein
VLLLLVVALRPTIPGGETGPRASGELEVWFVVDTTSSMAAEDYGDAAGATDPDAEPAPGATLASNTRLAGAKADIAAITERLAGAKFSLVSFDAATTQRVPLTSDGAAVESAASVLTQEVTTYSRGSSIDEPVELLTGLLEDAATAAPENPRVLFYLGDGEQTSGQEPGSFDALAPFLTGGAVLGYGTPEGGRMLEFDGFSDQYSDLGYIQDYSQTPTTDAVSMIDEAALGTIAEQLGVEYVHRTAGGDLDDILAGIDVGELTIEPGTPGTTIELYWIVAILLGVLVLAELVRVTGALSELRRQKGAAS